MRRDLALHVRNGSVGREFTILTALRTGEVMSAYPGEWAISLHSFGPCEQKE